MPMLADINNNNNMKKNLISVAIALIFCLGFILSTSENVYGSIMPNLLGLAMIGISGILFSKYKEVINDSFFFRDEQELDNNKNNETTNE